MFGLTKDYLGSEVVWNKTNELIEGIDFEKKNIFDYLDVAIFDSK